MKKSKENDIATIATLIVFLFFSHVESTKLFNFPGYDHIALNVSPFNRDLVKSVGYLKFLATKGDTITE